MRVRFSLLAPNFMKKLLTSLILCGMVLIVGCSTCKVKPTLLENGNPDRSQNSLVEFRLLTF